MTTAANGNGHAHAAPDAGAADPAPKKPWRDNEEDPNSLRAIIRANFPTSIDDAFPFLKVARTMTRDDLKNDLVAGLTVAVMVIPQGMAYAALASLRPEIGLYSCILPILTYALVGSSRQLAVGPVAMVALLTTAGLSPIVDPNEDPDRYQQLASTLAFMVGVMQAGMGLLRLEFIARFLPHPVLSGFTSAAAIVIGSSQIKDVFKIKIGRSERFQEIMDDFVHNVHDTHGLTFAVAATSIVFLLGARHAKRRFKAIKMLPEALVLVVFYILVSKYAEFDDKGVRVIGKVPAGFPSPRGILTSELGQLVGPALTISIVGFLESFAVAKTIAEKEQYPISAQRELIGLGAANLAGCFFKCMPVTGGFSRSAVNYQAGAKTVFAGAITAVALTLTVLFLTPLFTDLPKPILSAIIIVAVSTLVDLQEFVHLWATDKRDFLLVSCAFLCTLFWGLLQGILVSAALAVTLLVQRTANPHSAVLVKVRDDPPVFRNRERFPHGEPIPNVLIYRQDAPLFYANADSFQESILTLAGDGRTSVVIIHGGAMPLVDSTGAATLTRIRRRLSERNVRVVLCEFNGPVRDALRRAHVAYDADRVSSKDGESKDDSDEEEEGDACAMFVSLTDAVARARTLVRGAEEATPREVTVKLEPRERSGAARLSEDGAMTAVSADDL